MGKKKDLIEEIKPTNDPPVENAPEINPEPPVPNQLTVVEEQTFEEPAETPASEEPSDLDAKLDEKFPPANPEEKTQDEKIEEYLQQYGDLLAEHNKLITVSSDARVIAAGTVIATNTGNIVLDKDAHIKFDGSEQAFAGMLVSWHPQNISRNVQNLRLKYNGNAVLLPLGQQCAPGEIADFVPTLTPEEANGMGVTKAAYDRYVEAKAQRDAAEETEVSEPVEEEPQS